MEDEFNDWVYNNEDFIIRMYIDSIDIDSVPDEFIQRLYNKESE